MLPRRPEFQLLLAAAEPAFTLFVIQADQGRRARQNDDKTDEKIGSLRPEFIRHLCKQVITNISPRV